MIATTEAQIQGVRVELDRRIMLGIEALDDLYGRDAWLAAVEEERAANEGRLFMEDCDHCVVGACMNRLYYGSADGEELGPGVNPRDPWFTTTCRILGYRADISVDDDPAREMAFDRFWTEVDGVDLEVHYGELELAWVEWVNLLSAS